MQIDHILSLTVVGGFLDGTQINFGLGLNCIIGARGTGKTTILELIRYALDALPRKDLSPAARKRVELLVEGNLQGGRVELEIQTRDGLRYIITRAVGEAPIVLDSSRNPTSIVVGGTSFFRADIFSQNEVETIADHGKFQLELIDSFSLEEIAAMDRAADEIVQQLTAHAKQVQPLMNRLSSLGEDIKQLPAIEERLKGFATAGDQTSQAVAQAHAVKALRDRESRTLASANQFLWEFDAELSQIPGTFNHEFSGKFPKDLLDGPNGKTIAAVRSKLLDCSKSLDTAIQNMRKLIQDCAAGIQSEEAALQLAHHEQELAFRELIEKHKKHQTQSAERSDLERKRNALLECKAQSVEIARQIKDAEKRREDLLAKLSETRDNRFGLRKRVAERLNAALSPNITVSIQQDGNTDAYQELLETSLKGAGVRQGMVAQKLIRTLPPAHLASLVRSADHTSLMERGDLNPEQANKVIASFNTQEKLA